MSDHLVVLLVCLYHILGGDNNDYLHPPCCMARVGQTEHYMFFSLLKSLPGPAKNFSRKLGKKAIVQRGRSVEMHADFMFWAFLSTMTKYCALSYCALPLIGSKTTNMEAGFQLSALPGREEW